VKYPEPGDVSRRDVLRGFSWFPSELASAPFLVGCGSAWRWNPDAGEFEAETSPEPTELIAGFFWLFGKKGTVTRKPLADLWTNPPLDSDKFWLAGTGRLPMPKEMKVQIVEIWATGGVALARTTTGGVIRVAENGVSSVAVPGYCDAIATAEDGTFWGIFDGRELFHYKLSKQVWTKVLTFDAPPVGGLDRVLLAASRARGLAYSNTLAGIRIWRMSPAGRVDLIKP